MKITAEPRSDQWNADDFTGGPKTFTILGVKEGAAEQKYDIGLVEGEGRVWRPPLTMLRVLIKAWGDEAEHWAGKRVTLYLDPTVRFGSDTVGGIRISHLSDIGDKPLTVALSVSRGRRQKLTIQPLKEAPAEPVRDWDALIAGCTTEEELRALYQQTTDAGIQKRILAARDGLTTKKDD